LLFQSVSDSIVRSDMADDLSVSASPREGASG
jgi:hypothetical protein